jgi:hypothetical protein
MPITAERLRPSMTDEEFTQFLHGTYVALRQQMEEILALTVGFQALRETLQERDHGFDAAYLKKLGDLQHGELGRSNRQKLEQFDQVLEAMKNWKS